MIRLNFSDVSQEEHCIAHITSVLLALQSVLLVLPQSLERENGSGWKNSFETVSNVEGYHVYQSIWVPKIGEPLSTER